jgi:TonB family protein
MEVAMGWHASIAIVVGVWASAATAGGPTSQGDFMARHYPPQALKHGEEGKVGFRVAISKEGYIEQCEIVESSGYAMLDRETCDFIAQYASLKPARDDKGTAYATLQTGMVGWKLPSGVTRAPAPTKASALPPPLICKRGRTTGSMLAHSTACMTAAEWAIQDRLVRQALDERVGIKACTDHGC